MFRLSDEVVQDSIASLPEIGGSAVMRNLMLLLGLGVCLSSIGCAVPVGYGPGGGLPCDSCGDCNGGYVAGPYLGYGPIEALRQAKRNLVCGGGGCGEVYYGEWRSYPPDCADPCCGDSFVGGAYPCVPGWAPGALLPRNLVPALYGKRMYPQGDECGCGNDWGGCSDCGSTYGGEMIYEDGAHVGHEPGCNCGGHQTSSYQPAQMGPRSGGTVSRAPTPAPMRPARPSNRPTEVRTRTR